MHQCLKFILFGVTLYVFRVVFPSIIRACFFCLFGIDKFDIHRAMHCNIISIIKPTRCTNVSHLFHLE